MKEMKQMQKVMDEFFKWIDDPAEKKAREDERAKENNHRKEEGLAAI